MFRLTLLQLVAGEVCLLQHSLQLQAAHSFFVKFHKVGSGTWRTYVDLISGHYSACGGKCGCGNPGWRCRQYFPKKSGHEDEFELCSELFADQEEEEQTCPAAFRICTCHESLAVIRQALVGENLTTSTPHLADSENLWPDENRLQLLWKVDWARKWLPRSFQDQKLLATTILREPTERLRSYFYYVSPKASHADFKSWLELRRDFVAGNASLEALESVSRPMLLRACCEYETWLGGSLQKAKQALSTQFNLVAILERMSAGLVSLARLYGLSVDRLAQVNRLIAERTNVHDDSSVKLDWTPEELRLASYITRRDREIYDFSLELFKRQSLKLFGSEEALQEAVKRFEHLTT